MIRIATNVDFEELTAIWLEASIKAHDFISSAYWRKNADDMKIKYLPASQTWILEDDEHQALGFVSMLNNHIAALFITAEHQSKGLGLQLMLFLKSKYDRLTLNVYAQNKQALNFYLKNGFQLIKEFIDENTGEKDLLMEWNVKMI